MSPPAQNPTAVAQPLIAVRNVRASSRWYGELLGADPYQNTAIETCTIGSRAQVICCFNCTRGMRKTIPIS